ncbi:excalibur calcium-binding domain-containing protein [Kribbella sp. NPDC051620]|uniref:excalibur calcium-binding domain-containing protein n=1 Tax=Kribbella sp. NPDC051620 TaxID=3364120 RepID=UPI0037A8117A
MIRFQPALKAFAGLIAATALATACGATTTENRAASQTTVTTTVTSTPAAKPAPLVSIPPKKPATVVPTVKPPKRISAPKPTRKPTTHRTTTKPKPKPTATKTTASAYYANCTEVRAAGAAPIHRGEPGYSSKLDRDGDGVACE